MSALHIDINCDLGEGGDDAALMPLVTSANIACGGHAGDEASMRRAVDLALEYGANLGAHPGYEDRENFGRIEMRLPAASVRQSVVRQVRALQSIAAARGARLRHVKPHGALYNVAVRDPATAQAIVDAVFECDPTLAILTLPHGCLFDIATALCVEPIAECFADRTYQPDGTLTPRGDPRALHAREVDAADQVLWIARDGCVRAIDGTWLPMAARSICVHGAGARAVSMLRAVRSTLAAAKIGVKAF